MAEYIEREMALKAIDEYFHTTNPDGEEQIGVLKSRKVIRALPAADVEVVRHGKYDIYPLTIINDRYRGTYSGGAFTAWNHSFHEIPVDIDCGDCTCRDFWWLGKARKYRIGVGDTIEAAIEALADVMRNKEGK